MLNVLFQLKKELRLKITNEKLESLLLSHQDYPSIFSFSKTLDNIGIENKTGKIPSEQLTELSPIFLAYSIEDGLVLVTKISKLEINYFSGFNNSFVTENLDTFLQKWNSIILVIDNDATIKVSSTDLTLQRKKRIRNFVTLSFLLTLIIISFKSHYGILNLFTLTKLIGMYLCSLIIYSEINTLYKPKFCKHNDKINCEDVLNSKASKIFHWLSMSDIGALYFWGGFVSIWIASITPYFYHVISVINILSFVVFPYILFSIYYQYKIVKKWCVLCLSIQGLLFIESILSICSTHHHHIELSANGFLITSLSFLIIIIIWSYLKNILHKYFDYKEDIYKYLRLKNNPKIFSLLHENESSFNTSFPENHITFRSPLKTNKKITLVVNPYCNLCEKEYHKILKIIKSTPDFDFSLIFLETDGSNVSQFLIELYYKVPKSKFLTVLSFWFKHKKIDLLKDKYPMEISQKSQAEYLQHKNWCIQNNILQTPITIFNDRKLSDHYTVEDLIKF